MSWRVVVVSSNAKVDYQLGYLVVRSLEATKKVHMNEIAVLLLESTAVSITSYALCELTARKVKVVFCDHQRNPCAELVPLCGSHDTTAKIRQQMAWSPAARQNVWTEIVRAKIRAQRKVLEFFNCPQAALLTGYLAQLKYNDATNREGHAAKVYFNALFGLEFSRAAVCPVNAALNYGYGLLLSAVNREISAAGYLTQLGIFHDNTFNPFNFGSDLMEPLRPLVDHTVKLTAPKKFEKEEKLPLLRLLQAEVVQDGKRYPLLGALRGYCASVFRALQNGDVGELKFVDYELPLVDKGHYA